MTKAHVAAARQIARLERAAVILSRYHEELQAMPDSIRRVRLVSANRAAIARIERQTAKARTRITDPAAAKAV